MGSAACAALRAGVGDLGRLAVGGSAESPRARKHQLRRDSECDDHRERDAWPGPRRSRRRSPSRTDCAERHPRRPTSRPRRSRRTRAHPGRAGGHRCLVPVSAHDTATTAVAAATLTHRRKPRSPSDGCCQGTREGSEPAGSPDNSAHGPRRRIPQRRYTLARQGTRLTGAVRGLTGRACRGASSPERAVEGATLRPTAHGLVRAHAVPDDQRATSIDAGTESATHAARTFSSMRPIVRCRADGRRPRAVVPMTVRRPTRWRSTAQAPAASHGAGSRWP